MFWISSFFVIGGKGYIKKTVEHVFEEIKKSRVRILKQNKISLFMPKIQYSRPKPVTVRFVTNILRKQIRFVTNILRKQIRFVTNILRKQIRKRHRNFSVVIFTWPKNFFGQVLFSSACMYLSMCVSVFPCLYDLSQKVLDRFWWHFAGWSIMIKDGFLLKMS